MADKFYLDAEYETITQYSKASLEEFTHLHKFTKEIFSQGNKFYNAMKNTIDAFYDENKTSEPKTQLGNTLNFLYQGSSVFLTKTKGLLEILNQDIIEPIEQYQYQMKNYYDDTLKQFNKIAKTIKEAEKKVGKAKQKYYDSSTNEYLCEKELNKPSSLITSSITALTGSSEKDNDTLLKLKSQTENDCQMYKYEISNANKAYDEYSKKYEDLIKMINSFEESRLYFLKNNIDSYIKCYDDLIKGSTELISEMNKRLSTWKLEQDLHVFIEEHHFYTKENTQRIPKEIFKQFNSDTMVNHKSMNAGSNQIKSFFTKGKELIYAFGDYETIDIDYYNDELKEKLVDNFLSMLLNEKEIESDTMSRLMTFLSDNSQFPITFVNKYKLKQKTAYLQITNNKNLKHLANLFNTIFLNNSIEKDALYGITLYILYIAQRTYSYFSNKQKVFLCGILGRNKIFQTKIFWSKLIEFKLKTNLLSSKVKLEERYMQIVKAENEQTNANKGFFGMVGKGLYTIANNTLITAESKLRDTTNPYAEVVGFPIFYSLQQKMKDDYISKAHGELQKLIINFIPYYANYSFGTGNSIDFIVELGNKFSLSNEAINYYVICLNSASYSVKQKHPDEVKIYKDNHAYERDSKFPVFNPSFGGIAKSKDEDKGVLLEEVAKFLSPLDQLNLMVLSQRINTIIAKKIYRSFLNKRDLNNKVRIAIWGVLLRINAIKKKYNYPEICIVANQVKYDRSSNSPLSIIDFDVQRTLFDTNREESRNIITRILKTVAYLLPDITYCQGLNFIVKFLYLLCKNEDETFYLMMGLLQNTEYSSIFFNDLEKLKEKFAIFEKLLVLYLPVTHYFFSTNNIMPNYYLASWFITLFTGAMIKDDQLDSLIKVWDNFILFGWKTILYTGIVILGNQEERIIKMKLDQLLEYLTGDIIHSDFFFNYERFINQISKCLLKNQLIQNVENEIRQEKNFVPLKKS